MPTSTPSAVRQCGHTSEALTHADMYFQLLCFANERLRAFECRVRSAHEMQWSFRKTPSGRPFAASAWMRTHLLRVYVLAPQAVQDPRRATEDSDLVCRVLRGELCAAHARPHLHLTCILVKLSDEDRTRIKLFARQHINDRFVVWAYHPGATLLLTSKCALIESLQMASNWCGRRRIVATL